MESLVDPGCVEQFREIGIDISRTMQRIARADPDGCQMEIDVLLVNGKEVIVVEVKAKLKVVKREKTRRKPEAFQRRCLANIATKEFWERFAALV